MRSESVFSSIIAIAFAGALPQSVTERDALVKDKAFSAPPALHFRDAFQIAEDAAPQVIDFGKTARQQVAAGFLASNSAGAEHCHFAVLQRIEMTRGKILELSKAFDPGIDGAGECTHRDLECISGVDQKGVRAGDQIVPLRGLDMAADLPGRIGFGIPKRSDFFLEPDFEALKWHRRRMREFELEIIEPAGE